MTMSNNSQQFKIYAACGCNKGLVRSNNEDNFYFEGTYLDADNDGLRSTITCERIIPDSSGARGCFFAVYDGMGGTQYGEIASYISASRSEALISEYLCVSTDEVSAGLSEMCLVLNDAVYRESFELSVRQMGSTIAGVYFREGKAWCFNVGDSKCFRLRNGMLQQLSVDHNDAESLRIAGVTGRKPSLTQFLGVDPEELLICADTTIEELEYEDTFLICSDGLTDMVSPEKITEILLDERSEEKQAEQLITEALNNGGKDNTTVIICRIS